MSQSPPDTLGKYQIIREIARSNDIVYEGYDPVMNRRVAVKELAVPSGATTQQKEDRIKRFMREAKAAGSLVHPNIVTVYDVAEQGGRYYLAMEFLDGQTLRKTLEDQGNLTTDYAIEVTIEIAKALTFAHTHGVVHRDVKPENIQILENGAIKLTDFGIARLTFEPNITMDGQVFGTPSYMSPEQINGRDIDARSDIFSLGIILYEMIAGKKPFTGDSVVTITYAIMNSEPQTLSSINQMVWNAITKALDKTPHLRQSSCEEFINELKHAQKSVNVVLDPTPASSYNNPPPVQSQQAYNNLLNSPVTPYGTPNPLYNPQQAHLAQAQQQQNQYQYAQPQTQGQQAAIYAPYNPGQAHAPQQQPYGQPYAGAAYPAPQVPAYYPPPPRKARVTISPEASANLTRFIIAVLIIGGICGILIFGLNAITSAASDYAKKAPSPQSVSLSPSSSNQNPVPNNTKQPTPTSQPTNQTKNPTPQQPEKIVNQSNQPKGDPETFLLDAETLVDQGAREPTARIREEFWKDANEKFRDAKIIAPERANDIDLRARNKYVQTSNYLFSQGSKEGSRAALYKALAFSNNDAQRAEIQAQIEALGG
ncbi:MAG: serine/threonine protein kinase [Fimbriimonadaceae bacterium]